MLCVSYVFSDDCEKWDISFEKYVVWLKTLRITTHFALFIPYLCMSLSWGHKSKWGKVLYAKMLSVALYKVAKVSIRRKLIFVVSEVSSDIVFLCYFLFS